MNNGIQTYINSVNANTNNYKSMIIEKNGISSNHNLGNKEENILKASNSDTIEIKQSSDLVINTKKAHDAFRDSCKEIGETSWNGYQAGDMSGYYITICDIMETRGYKVPNIFYNGDIKDLANNSDFIGFIDKMNDFVKTDPILKNNYPKKFFDFTKLYKEKLIQYGCK